VVSADAAFDGAHGNAPFRDAVPVALVAQGRATMQFVLVRRDAGIRAVEDLAGRTMIAKRRAMPHIELIANALLDVSGVPKDKVKYVETVEAAQATAALRTGSAQVAVYPGRQNLPPLRELFHDKVVDFLDVSEAKMRDLVAKLPKYFYLARVPAGTFENQPKEWISPALNTYLVAHSNAPEELVYKVTKAIMGNPASLATYHVEGNDWTIANALAEPKLAFHPGAIRYYKEAGAWRPPHDLLQTSLQAK
jgi:TRAP transporter TAXI family solute receptor